jgi:hypothetical protein
MLPEMPSDVSISLFAWVHFYHKFSLCQENKFSFYFLHGYLPKRQRGLVAERYLINILERLEIGAAAILGAPA